MTLPKNPIDARDDFVDALRSCVGAPYLWGGNDPSIGVDCSGMVCYCLRAAGVLIGDHTAADIADALQDYSVPEITNVGQLCFYGRAKITHVMAVARYWGNGRGVLVGARGGGRSTTSIPAAWSQRAYVATTLSDYWRSELVLVVDPWK